MFSRADKNATHTQKIPTLILHLDSSLVVTKIILLGPNLLNSKFSALDTKSGLVYTEISKKEILTILSF